MITGMEALREPCCHKEGDDSFGDCDTFRCPKGPAAQPMQHWGGDVQLFFTDYVTAWNWATENGMDLCPLGQDCSDGDFDYDYYY